MAPRAPALQPAKSTLSCAVSWKYVYVLSSACAWFEKCTTVVFATATPVASVANSASNTRWPRNGQLNELDSAEASPTHASLCARRVRVRNRPEARSSHRAVGCVHHVSASPRVAQRVRVKDAAHLYFLVPGVAAYQVRHFLRTLHARGVAPTPLTTLRGPGERQTHLCCKHNPYLQVD